MSGVRSTKRPQNGVTDLFHDVALGSVSIDSFMPAACGRVIFREPASVNREEINGSDQIDDRLCRSCIRYTLLQTTSLGAPVKVSNARSVANAERPYAYEPLYESLGVHSKG